MEAIDYLTGAFVSEAAELENVARKADEARKTLEEFAVEGAWPYELVDGKPPNPRKPDGQISHSTSAMNLFALGVACGRVKSLTLAPYVGVLKGKKGTTAREKFDRELQSFLEAIKQEERDKAAKGETWHLSSGTYGDDDPLTLLWMLEMCRELRGNAPDTLKQMAGVRYASLVGSAVDRVKNIFEQNAEPDQGTASEQNTSPAGSTKPKQNEKPWEKVFTWPEGRPKPEFIEHSFPMLRVVQLYDHLRAAKKANDPNLKAGTESRKALDKLSTVPLERYFHDRLHLHLSYSQIQDSSYDAAELAFTMEALLLLDEDSVDAATVARCRHVLLKTQEANSYWRPLRPFLATPQGMVLLPLSVETANSLIRSFEILRHRERSSADRSGDAALFQRYTEWLFGRIVHGEVAPGRPFAGWRSEHADDRGKIHTWETSQVLLYLLQYDSFLRSYRAERALRCMNLQVTESPGKVPKRTDPPPKTAMQTPIQRWTVGIRDGTKDEDEEAFVLREPVSSSSKYLVMNKIGEQFLQPRSVESPSSGPAVSMLLYGPQGTGKTTIAKSIAESLGWPLISVSPSDFMVSGDSLVEARAKQLFDVLTAQTNAVILLDEIDRLVLDRGSEAYGKQSDPFQLMTPGMLTKLQILHDEGRSVFIISTNYAERIDPAIKRAGRVDEQYLILPPDRAQRRRTFGVLFDKAKVPDKLRLTEGELDEIVRDTVLWVFSELKNLVVAVTMLERDEKARMKPDWDRARFLKELRRLIVDRPPAIRLGDYTGRFKGKTTSAGEKPYEEALMLLYLVAESNRDIKSEEEGLWKILTGADEDVSANVSAIEVIKDYVPKPIRERLYTSFDEHLAALDKWE